MTPKDCFREHPILFSAPMVRAILDGSKTQTRRPVRPQPTLETTRYEIDAGGSGKWMAWGPSPATSGTRQTAPWMPCPYGQPGDRLWVRESFSPYERREGCWYWADGNIAAYDCSKPKPSIHMPRWASRITLEVTGVRVERLRDISEADATAEGARAVPWGTWWQGYQDLGDMDLIHQEARGEAPPEWMIEPKRMKDRPWLDRSAVAEFRTLWESINGAGNWDANPWVWVVEFRRIDHGDVA